MLGSRAFSYCTLVGIKVMIKLGICMGAGVTWLTLPNVDETSFISPFYFSFNIPPRFCWTLPKSLEVGVPSERELQLPITVF